MRNIRILLVFLFIIACGVIIAEGCGGCSNNIYQGTPVSYTNLVFAVTPDLTNNAGDINPRTANLSNQGLQRALKLATYLKTTILNSANPNGIYALEPCTHTNLR